MREGRRGEEGRRKGGGREEEGRRKGGGREEEGRRKGGGREEEGRRKGGGREGGSEGVGETGEKKRKEERWIRAKKDGTQTK